MNKYLISVTALALAGTAFANAQVLEGNYYVTMEGFFAGATDDIVKDWQKVNIGGLWGTCGMTVDSAVPGLSFDFAGVSGIGGGSTEEDSYYSGAYEENKITQVDFFVGGQAGLNYQFCERFSMSAGVMAGIDFRSSEAELEYHDVGGYIDADDDDFDAGFFYGLFVRADTKLTQRWSLTASYRFMGTTTKNEWNLAGIKLETEKTNYNMVTVGAKFEF